jgi:RNA polymerase sigma-70 factor (ECF subfamily)
MKTATNTIETDTWQAYRDALYRFVLKRVGDADAAEDIVQDVLVKACAQQETLREPAKLRSWLYTITRNAVIDFYRLRKPLAAIPDELIQENPTGVEELAMQELAPCLLPLLATLPRPYREALRLADFEGVKQREIASALGLSWSGAKSRVQRARKMLRDALLDCCRVELDRQGRVVDYDVGTGCENC